MYNTCIAVQANSSLHLAPFLEVKCSAPFVMFLILCGWYLVLLNCKKRNYRKLERIKARSSNYGLLHQVESNKKDDGLKLKMARRWKRFKIVIQRYRRIIHRGIQRVFSVNDLACVASSLSPRVSLSLAPFLRPLLPSDCYGGYELCVRRSKYCV